MLGARLINAVDAKAAIAAGLERTLVIVMAPCWLSADVLAGFRGKGLAMERAKTLGCPMRVRRGIGQGDELDLYILLSLYKIATSPLQAALLHSTRRRSTSTYSRIYVLLCRLLVCYCMFLRCVALRRTCVLFCLFLLSDLPFLRLDRCERFGFDHSPTNHTEPEGDAAFPTHDLSIFLRIFYGSTSALL